MAVDRALFEGRMVRLTAFDPDQDAGIVADWWMNSEFLRLYDSDPACPHTLQFVQHALEESGASPNNYVFGIRTLTDHKLIGRAELDGLEWPHATGWVSIGIGDPDYWGQGYGSDAMRELLRFAFNEVGLYRISLDLFSYNQRAFQMYEKLGFKEEGRQRGLLKREGQRWDLIYMGLLKPEWQEE